MMKKGRSDGFTLVELLITVGIMIILTAIGLGNFNFSRIKGKDAKRKADLTQLARAIETFNEDFGFYPESDVDGNILGCNPSGDISTFNICPWGTALEGYPRGGTEKQTYIAEISEDPNSTRRYFYESDQVSFSLYAALENDLDPHYQSDLTPDCNSGGSSIKCNYRLTNIGVEEP
ncbi:type II secretion system protein [Candidatus Collierbacteria bacterium]|nr:type II secretion system protein [Candidatus Collierbacteria bacterium]